MANGRMKTATMGDIYRLAGSTSQVIEHEKELTSIPDSVPSDSFGPVQLSYERLLETIFDAEEREGSALKIDQATPVDIQSASNAVIAALRSYVPGDSHEW